MNNSLVEKDYVFQTAIHFEEGFLLNLYEIKLSMVIVTDNLREQNIAIERINYFIESSLDSCVFVNQSEESQIKKYDQAGIKVCVIPEEPYDQIIGMVLMMKLNAIMEDKVRITEIIFGSKMSTGVKFIISYEEAEAYYAGDFWYNHPSLSIRDIPKTKSKKEKIVNLFVSDDWTKLNLNWKEKQKID